MKKSLIRRIIGVVISLLQIINYLLLPVLVISAPILGKSTEYWSMPVLIGKLLVGCTNGMDMTGLMVNQVLGLPTEGIITSSGLMIGAMILSLLSIVTLVFFIIGLLIGLIGKNDEGLLRCNMLGSVLMLLLTVPAFIIRGSWNTVFDAGMVSLMQQKVIDAMTFNGLRSVFSWGAGFILAIVLSAIGIGLWIYSRFVSSYMEDMLYKRNGLDDQTSYRVRRREEDSSMGIKRIPPFIFLESGGNTIRVNKVPCVIGRNRSAVDFYLYDESLSRRHCMLDIQRGDVWIKDLNSLYGVWVNEGRIPSNTPVCIRTGDTVRLGEVKFRVSVNWDEIAYQMPEKARERAYSTITYKVPESQMMTAYQQSMAMVSKAVPRDRETIITPHSIEIHEGETPEWIPSVILCPDESCKEVGNCHINNSPFIIGRSHKRADFVIDNLSVSRVHCRISYENNTFYIEDMQSANGVRVNGERLRDGDKRRLSFNDQIRLGDVIFYFRA